MTAPNITPNGVRAETAIGAGDRDATTIGTANAAMEGQTLPVAITDPVKSQTDKRERHSNNPACFSLHFCLGF